MSESDATLEEMTVASIGQWKVSEIGRATIIHRGLECSAWPGSAGWLVDIDPEGGDYLHGDGGTGINLWQAKLECIIAANRWLDRGERRGISK